MPENSNTFTKVILVMISIIFTLFLAEIICRYHYFGKLSMGDKTPDGQFVRYDELMGWSMIPNSEGYFSNPSEGYHGYVKYDVYGIRVNDNSFRREGSSMLVIGDSVTSGLEVDNNDAYVAILEKLFYENGCKYRIYNAGVRGYGTDQSFWNLERLISIVNPKYVIYMFNENDFVDNRTIKKSNRIYGKPVFIFDNNKLNILNRPSKKFAFPYYSIVEYSASGYKVTDGYITDTIPHIKGFFKNNLAIYHPLKNVYDYFHNSQMSNNKEKAVYPDFEILELILKKMKSYDFELLLTSFPDENTELYANDIKRLSDKLNIIYLDISPFFTEKSKKYHWKSDRHWNEKGHLQAATALYEVLKPNLCIQDAARQKDN
jgi:lysophospholipase L1-like esterase